MSNVKVMSSVVDVFGGLMPMTNIFLFFKVNSQNYFAGVI